MTQNSQIAQNRREYSKISYQTRLKLINLVEDQHYLISSAAKKLNIKLSTAKVIISGFKKSGKIFERKEDRLRRQITEQEKQRTASQNQPIFVFIPPMFHQNMFPWNPFFPQ